VIGRTRIAAGAVLVTLIAIATSARSSPAGADAGATRAPVREPPKKKIVGILDVRVDGVSPTAAERFESSLEEQLGSTEYWVATRKRMREILAGSKWSEGCSFGPCLLEVRKQTGADLIVDAYFSGAGSSYRFVVTLVDTATGQVTAQVADHCDVCTMTEALDSAALATIGLVHGADGEVAATPSPTSPAAPHEGASDSPVRSLRRSALLLAGSAVIVAGTAAYFLHAGKDELGYSAAGAAAGLGVAGIAVLGISFQF
jgi:hypothetical protein